LFQDARCQFGFHHRDLASTSPNASISRKPFLRSVPANKRRIGQDLHDGLGQHLTGIAFMSKVQEQKLMEKEPA
jgi:signal transduction histidine kinase